MENEDVINTYTLQCIYTHIMEYYPAIKKNEILPFATTQINLEAKCNKSDRERQISRFDLYVKS